MRSYLFAKRNGKEILRDPINFFFGLGFPLILLALLSFVNANIPPEANNPMFEIENLAPGLAMFGTVFMALFVGMLLAKDRMSSFLLRLFSSPMTAADFLLGYSMPALIVVAVQASITLAASVVCGLPSTPTLPLAVLVTALASLLFVGIGLLCGSLMNDKAVGGICGALLTNVAGWLSGVFIPIGILGGTFQTIAHALPFFHITEAIKTALNGNLNETLVHLCVVLSYAAVVYLIAVLAFTRKMNGGK